MPKRPNILRIAATIPFGFSIAACSGDVVDLGGGSAEVEGTVPAACAGLDGDGNVTVVDQAGLDALRGCEELGALSIMDFGGTGLDLRPLSSLRVVRGFLSIEGDMMYDMTTTPTVRDTSLSSLEGLESLKRVGGLVLSRFSAPTLWPLRNLSEVSGGESASIQIDNASHLRSLNGLENAVGIRAVGLSYNPELETLDGLQLPNSVAGIGVSESPKLKDIEALRRVQGVDQVLYIHDTGIERLNLELQVLGTLDVGDNAALTEITGLDSMIMSDIKIQNNPRLTRLPEFSRLLLLDSLYIVGNSQLQAVPTFPALEGGLILGIAEDSPMRLLEIADNASLQQYVAPAQLRGMASLVIRDNASLSEIDLGGLEALTRLTIANNPGLVSVSLDRLQTVNSLELLDNGQLPTAGFSAVQTFTRNVQGNAGDVAP